MQQYCNSNQFILLLWKHDHVRTTLSSHCLFSNIYDFNISFCLLFCNFELINNWSCTTSIQTCVQLVHSFEQAKQTQTHTYTKLAKHSSIHSFIKKPNQTQNLAKTQFRKKSMEPNQMQTLTQRIIGRSWCPRIGGKPLGRFGKMAARRTSAICQVDGRAGAWYGSAHGGGSCPWRSGTRSDKVRCVWGAIWSWCGVVRRGERRKTSQEK